MIAQILIPTAEVTIPAGTTANEAPAEIKTKPLMKISRKENKKTFDLFRNPKIILIICTH